MKKLLLISLFLTLAACGSDTTTTAPAPSITGSWVLTYAGSGCVETYSYSNGTLYITSLDEIVNGTYQTGITVNGKTELEMNYITDNGLSDCLGQSIDDSGQVAQIYYTVSDTTLSFYSNSTDSTALTSLTRQ